MLSKVTKEEGTVTEVRLAQPSKALSLSSVIVVPLKETEVRFFTLLKARASMAVTEEGTVKVFGPKVLAKAEFPIVVRLLGRLNT